uniref:Uncharacterized protein n=1 Tax=Glyptapanteles indiensis TaxID=92994 RepID=B7S966_GLYIN|nr:conserved hypothetical protein [Glyptapanteles indiensis]
MFRRFFPDTCSSVQNEILESDCSHQDYPDSYGGGCSYDGVGNARVPHQTFTNINQIQKSGGLSTVGDVMHEVESSMLHAELSKQLHEIGRSTNHMLQVWKRDLPSEHKHRKSRRVQQAGAAAEQHQFPGTQEEVLGFYSSSAHLHSKNNYRNEQRVKQKCRLPTICENMIWLKSDSSTER